MMQYISLAITILFFVFPFIGFFRKHRTQTEYQQTHTVAVIAAHNEEQVIANVIQDCWQAGFSEVVVIADACDDATVRIAHNSDCRVIEVNQRSKTKALREGIPLAIYGLDNTAVVMFFDADNRIGADFLTRALPYFQNHDMIQCRVRNLNVNAWVARMYLIMMGSWARFQDALTVCHASNILCGTGWGARAICLKRWPNECSTLTEDLEYTGITRAKIYYARDVDCWDEKPASFAVSVRQRTRWVRGAWQVIFTRWKDFDPKKVYVMLIPTINTWFVFLFFRSLLLQSMSPSATLAFAWSLIVSTIINVIYYAILLDARDLARISVWDLLTYTAWTLTNYPIVVWGLLTWKRGTWYRTPHVGVKT